MPLENLPPQELVDRARKSLAHAWMVRSFIKHSEEAEEFPELMQMVRTVFDTARALESRSDDPAVFFRLLGKKLGKLRKAAEQFRSDAPAASSHMNFQQAVISLDAAVEELETLLEAGRAALERG